MSSTYAELQTEGLAWLRNAAVADQITNLIAQVEDELNGQLRVSPMIVEATASIDAETAILPTDFLELRSIRLTSPTRVLRSVSQEEMAVLKRNTTTTGEPYAYAIRGGAFEFVPVPDKAYAATLVYVAKIPALSDSNPTNWVLDRFPMAYLNGLLARGYMFLKNFPAAQAYTAAFGNDLTKIRAANRTVYDARLRSDIPRARRTYSIYGDC